MNLLYFHSLVNFVLCTSYKGDDTCMKQTYTVPHHLYCVGINESIKMLNWKIKLDEILEPAFSIKNDLKQTFYTVRITQFCVHFGEYIISRIPCLPLYISFSEVSTDFKHWIDWEKSNWIRHGLNFINSILYLWKIVQSIGTWEEEVQGNLKYLNVLFALEPFCLGAA